MSATHLVSCRVHEALTLLQQALVEKRNFRPSHNGLVSHELHAMEANAKKLEEARHMLEKAVLEDFDGALATTITEQVDAGIQEAIRQGSIDYFKSRCRKCGGPLATSEIEGCTEVSCLVRPPRNP
jgi:hypothetical protein